jgi:hypothetical protein
MKKLNYFFSSALLAVLLFASATVMGQNPFYVNLIQPNTNGIDIVIGDDYLISWEDNLSQPVDVYLGTYNTTTFVFDYTPIETDIIGSTYIWDTDAETAGVYKIKVQSSTSPTTYYTENVIAFDLVNYASTDEIVVEQPSVTGISWAQGSVHTIYWRNTFMGDDVKIEYGNDVDGWIPISDPVTGNSLDWTVPNTPGPDFKVRITSNNHAGLIGESALPFTITASSGTVQEIYQPNYSSVWDMDKKYLISWKDDLTETVDIAIKDMNTNTITTIVQDVSGSTYEWNLALLPSGYIFHDDGRKYEIVIKSHISGPYMWSQQFIIVETIGSISVINQPLTDASWTVGTRHQISWLDNLEGPVNVIYNNFDGNDWVGWITIESNVVGTTCYWDIPDADNIHVGDNSCIIIVQSTDDLNYWVNTPAFDLTLSSGTDIEVIQPNVEKYKIEVKKNLSVN